MISEEEFKKILLSPSICSIGKHGITKELLAHIEKLVKQHKIIKINIAKSMAKKIGVNEIANKLTEKTNFNILDIRGRKIILSKFKRKK